MKMALLTDGIYPFVIGGMQRHSYFLAKYLARHQIFVRVYHCIPTDEQSYEEKLRFVFSEAELEYLEFVCVPFDFVARFPGYYILESYRYSKRIFEHLQRDFSAFDFIYAKGFTSWYLLQHKWGDVPPVGIKLHGYEMYQYAFGVKEKLQHYLLRFLARYVSMRADVVFSYGGKISELLINRLHIPFQKIIELPAGIEESLISVRCTEYHDPVRFVFVGRYEERKGIRSLNKAIQRLIAQKEAFEFHFIGAIPKHMQIKDARVKYYGVLWGYVAIKDILKEMDVGVCPSYSEGMPNVIIEAMANGLTVIATDVGAVRLLVNEETGYLIENNEVDTLVQVLTSVIHERKEVLQLKKEAALQHIQRFKWEDIIKRFVEEIKRFLLLR